MCIGKWILKKDFLEDSIKAGKWVSEEMYEWNEQSTVTGLSVSHMAAPGRWRTILQQKRGSFEGWKVLVAVADVKKRAAYKRLEIAERYFNRDHVNRRWPLYLPFTFPKQNGHAWVRVKAIENPRQDGQKVAVATFKR